VASNLRYGDEKATDVELWKALEDIQAKEFVSEMSGELEGEIDRAAPTSPAPRQTPGDPPGGRL